MESSCTLSAVQPREPFFSRIACNGLGSPLTHRREETSMLDTQLRAAPSSRSALMELLTDLSELLGITIWAVLGVVAIAAAMDQLRRQFAARDGTASGAPRHAKSDSTGCDARHSFNAPVTWAAPRG